MTDILTAPTTLDALAKLAEIPAVGSEERDAWLKTARQYIATECRGFQCIAWRGLLALMSETRKQGQRDALGAAPKDDEAAMCLIREAALIKTSSVQEVLAERRRQVEAEGWTPEHDDRHQYGEMAKAAGLYALNAAAPPIIRDQREAVTPARWPWSVDWWKPTTPRRDLIKAAALILAEIERLDRAALATGGARHG